MDFIIPLIHSSTKNQAVTNAKSKLSMLLTVFTARRGSRFCLGLIFLLPLHSSVLKPDFYLTFRQAKGMGDLYASSSGEVTVKVELLFQFKRLITGVRLSPAFPLCKNTRILGFKIKSNVFHATSLNALL